MRRDVVLAGNRLEQMAKLVDEGVAPADRVAGRPPVAEVGVVGGLGHEHAPESRAVRQLQLVQPLEVEDERALRAVHLEDVRVQPPTRQPRGFQRPGRAVVELDRRDELVVDLATVHERADERRDRGDLADEVAPEVDQVRAQIAEHAGARLGRVEAPARGVGLPAPRL